jgi:hypothetical protein
MEGKEIKIEGKPAKRFRVYQTDINNEPYKCEGEYDTVHEVNSHRWRLDRRYKIAVNRKFMTRSEFREWAKSQK